MTLTVDRKGNMVDIIIEDDGLGLKTKNVYYRTIGNIRERLHHNFPDSSVVVEDISQGGVRAKVSIPIHPEPLGQKME